MFAKVLTASFMPAMDQWEEKGRQNRASSIAKIFERDLFNTPVRVNRESTGLIITIQGLSAQSIRKIHETLQAAGYRNIQESTAHS